MSRGLDESDDETVTQVGGSSQRGESGWEMRAISRRVCRLENGLGLVETGEERRWREQLERRMAAARARLGQPEPDRDKLREDTSGLTLAEALLRGRQRMQLSNRAGDDKSGDNASNRLGAFQ